MTSKIALKLGLLIAIQTIVVIASFSILSYYQSQGVFLANSINVAGKNRFLTSNLMFEISKHIISLQDKQFSKGVAPAIPRSGSDDLSKIDSAARQLESNILTLQHGGRISGIDLKPLPPQFIGYWNIIYQKWLSLKSEMVNSVMSTSNQPSNLAAPQAPNVSSSQQSAPIRAGTSAILSKVLEPKAASLIDSSNILVTQLGEYSKSNSQALIFLEAIFAAVNIAVSAAIFYLVLRTLKPILI